MSDESGAPAHQGAKTKAIFSGAFWLSLSAVLIGLVIVLILSIYNPIAITENYIQIISLITVLTCVLLFVGDVSNVLPIRS
jgi:uncharacterized membrane protein YhaH (DUF805 family)